VSDRAPAGRTPSDKEKDEARRFLGTPMATAMIRGIRDEDRARAWLGTANELRQEGEVGPATVERLADKVRELSD
jgi:hypothetical protein